jgi:potassium-dependent mechanosensitive channel
MAPRKITMLFAALLLLGSSPAQVPTPKPAPPPPAAPSVEDQASALREQQAKVSDEIAAIDKRLTEPEIADSAAKDLRSTRERLAHLKLILSQSLGAVERGADLANELEEAKDKLKAITETGLDTPPPYSFLVLESLRESLQIELAKRDARGDAATATSEHLASAQAEAQAAASALRQAREKATADPAAPVVAELRALTLDSRIKIATAELRKTEAANDRLDREAQSLRLAILEKTVAIMAPQALFSRKDLDAQLLEIEKHAERINRELESLKLNLDYAEQKWIRAREKQEQGASEHALAEAAHWRTARQIYQQGIAAYTAQLERHAPLRLLWERRFRVQAGVDSETLTKWRSDNTQQIEHWQRDSSLRAARVLETRKEIESLGGQPPSPWVGRNQRVQQKWLDIQEDDQKALAAELRLAEKLAEELDTTDASKLALLWASSSAIMAKVWHLELTTIDDKAITVSKVVLGIVLFILGALVARLVSRQTRRRLLTRMKVNESAAHAIQTIVFYVLLVTFTLLALQMVNVPLTAFTILGGALAIGVGFGSQSIMNNFISGLILLIERPIKIGDLVQVGELYGLIESIGARSTLIRSGDNIDIVVPNSEFLQRNVINWTRSNRRVRVKVSLGVAYGSPVEKVRELLLECLKGQARVLQHETPVVLFSDFGDDALKFDLLFWISMRTQTDRLLAESDVRFAIDRLFNEAGIVIAFPQRDVHLDVSTPIPVNLSKQD